MRMFADLARLNCTDKLLQRLPLPAAVLLSLRGGMEDLRVCCSVATFGFVSASLFVVFSLTFRSPFTEESTELCTLL